MTLLQVNLKESVHFRGAYRDYIHADHEWVDSITGYDTAVDVELKDGRTLTIPKSNIAAEMRGEE